MIERPSKVPRGQLQHGDVVEVYRTSAGQKHHTDRACGLLTRRDGDVETAKVPVDDYGGLQLSNPLCDDCGPFYRRAAVGWEGTDD